MRGAVARFDPQGKLLETIADHLRLGRITGLAVQGATWLVADATHHTVHLYHHQQWQYELGREVNTRGFMIPNGLLDLALDAPRETVLVAHPQKHRVERYRFDGQLTAKFGRFGMHDPADFGGCCNPTNITTTPDGLIAVSEKAPPRVKLFTADGIFLAQSTTEIFDPATKNIDLAVDTRGRLYATDQVRCAIEVFQLEPAGE
jgi:sugar lactone lactonase YvrE